MKNMELFKNFGLRSGENIYATRKHIEDLYKVPKRTLVDNIEKLKEDGLVNGAKIRTLAKDGRNRMQEVFSLEESIAIGFRLRSDTAIKLQRYATMLIRERMNDLEEQKRLLELELSYAWNKSDNDDLFR